MSSMPANPNHDPALAAAPGQPPTSAAIAAITDVLQQQAPNGMNGVPQISGLKPDQIMTLLKHLPSVMNKINEQPNGGAQEDAAQILSNLSQSGNLHGSLPPQQQSYQAHALEAGPASHPNGPPSLGQLGQLVGAALRANATRIGVEQGNSDVSEGPSGNENGKDGPGAASATPPSTRRGGRSSTMGSDEWSRQRKDNHKEVERRRRGNINEGINELGRIVPNGSGEKAKGAILSRAVQYIHHLKENEARNIEKWTLEKLLMDQAMGDLQAQLEEVRRVYDEERSARQRAESELEVLRGLSGGAQNEKTPETGKRRSAEAEAEGERDGKKQRTE